MFPWTRIKNLLNRRPFSKKRSIVLEENQGEMGYEGTPVKARPNTRRRMLPPTPQQSSHSSMDGSSGKRRSGVLVKER